MKWHYAGWRTVLAAKSKYTIPLCGGFIRKQFLTKIKEQVTCFHCVRKLCKGEE
jgi:hypothetical protein